jgi:hypothetical protein
MPMVATTAVDSATRPSVGRALIKLERSEVALKLRRWAMSKRSRAAAIRSDTIVPPRAACAIKVITSTVITKAQERLCPRFRPRASIIRATPAMAVVAVAPFTTSMGR